MLSDDDDVSILFSLSATDLECGDVPLLTPGSKEMMSQALKATFSGFTKEQQRLGIPKGKHKFHAFSQFFLRDIHHMCVSGTSAILYLVFYG